MNYLFNKNSWLYRTKNIGLSNGTIVTIVLLSLVSTVTEMIGIGIFLPIFQFIRLDGDLDVLVADMTIWQYIVNLFVYLNIEPSLLILILIAFLFFSGRQLFIYVRLIYIKAVTQRLIQNQCNVIFDSYLEADEDYHDEVPVGDLVNIVMTEISSAISGLMSPMDLIVYVITFIGYLSILFILSWEMTVISIVVMSIASMAPKVWINQSVQVGRTLVNANKLMSEFLLSRIKSPRLIRLSGTESVEKREFHNLTLSQRKHQVFNAILNAKTIVVMDPIVIGLSLIFLYFSYSVLQLQVEVIGLYMVIALRLMPVVQSIIVQFQSIKSSLGSIEALENRINEMRKHIEQDAGVLNLDKINYLISFKNVSYRYPSGRYDVLKDITVEFKVNKLTAVVGPSGSGKSTLIDLLPRLRLPSKGLIQIDGISIEMYKLKSLRKLLSYVSQSPQIFNGTVKDHILYGKENATDKEVQEAAYLAGAEGFINLMPQGFDTILSEGATNISGGQRQRLDLARALVKKAPILILDEPTSSLDAESEEIFNRALSRICKKTDTIVIIVAHRLASISDADNIIVLNQGKVESSGKHFELLNQNGWYAKAWNIQK